MGALADFKASLAEKLNIHLTSNSKSRKQVIKHKIKAKGNATVEQQTFVFNMANLKETDRNQILSLLSEKFKNGDVYFVDDDSKQLAESVEKVESNSEVGDLVSYFEDKLKPTDWQIFRTGLFIDHLIQQRMPTSELRKSVIQTYGTRGRNILNLASSGHFATHIKPLYEEMAKAPNFSKEKFYEEFERILKEMPFAIFVNSLTTSDKLRSMIEDRLQQAMDYSVENRKIYIQGWGANVKTIENCIEKLDSSLRITINKRKEFIEVIDVTVEF